MSDLKELLEPLQRREMPDRWEAIQWRPIAPMPEPRRSRTGAFVVSGIVGLVAIAVIARLSPLGGGGEAIPREPNAPPAWLVKQAYSLAVENEDPTPDGAWWTTTTANTITPSPGPPTGSPMPPRYLVVLEGDFVANAVPVLSGEGAPKGHWTYATFDPDSHGRLDFGIGNEAVDVSTMQPLDLSPQPFTAGAGWTALLPPGWQATPIDPKDPAQAQVVISATDPSAFLYSPDPVPNVTTAGFPVDGVAVVVTKAPPGVGSFAPVSPPVSLGTDAERSSGADGSTSEIVLVQGPDAVYSIAVRTGRKASSIDVKAVHDVVASIGF